MVSSNKSWMQSFIPFALEELHCYDVTLWRDFFFHLSHFHFGPKWTRFDQI
jgi:hypothetical protein